MSRLAVLINPRSGSVPADAESQLRHALEELGESAEFQLLDQEDICQPIDECYDTRPDAVIVWSGDGTVACALERAGADGPPILPLPGGTMNLFHKQIHGDALDWRECLEKSLKQGQQIDVPAGCAGDRRFYVAAMAGKLTDLAGPREALRGGRVFEAVERLAGADVLDFTHAMQFKMKDAQGAEASGVATAAAIFVGTQRDSEFEFAFINPDNTLELASAGIGALISDWREANGVTTLKAPRIRLEDSKGYDLRLTLDGDPARLKSGTEFHRIAKAGRAISAGYE